jgi:hypothetical protein
MPSWASPEPDHSDSYGTSSHGSDHGSGDHDDAG